MYPPSESVLRRDCRHFPGDRPCRFHKDLGLRCDTCDRFEPVGRRVLIVKLDALGDVLRTTCLLPSLKRDDPSVHVTWCTRPEAAPVLAHNPLIDERILLTPEGIARLQVEHFDLVLSPDASKAGAALAGLAGASETRGFILGRDGQVRALGPEPDAWLAMGADDDLKRANRSTYQTLVHRICALRPDGQQIVLRLTPEEQTAARAAAAGFGLDGAPVVGLNTGASPRWPRKRWTREGYLELARRLLDEGCRILLLGGALEDERNRWLAERSGRRAVYPGPSVSLRSYFAWIDLCDVVVTGDTLGLHAALALGARVVALFGPTSAHEIDLYGRGTRVVADMDCVCCYRTHCDRKPGCMESIDADRVFRAALDEVEAACGAPA